MDSEQSTPEVAARLGVSIAWLRKQIDGGYLAPRSEGEGRGRRYFWRDVDAKLAKDLKDGNGTKSEAEALIGRMGGVSFVMAWHRAQSLAADRVERGDVVVVGPATQRVFRHDDSVKVLYDHLRSIGGTAVVVIA